MASASRRLVFQRTARHHVLQGEAVQKLHGDEALALVLANLVDGANVGMVEGGGGAGFAAEAFECLRILRHVVGKKLESDKSTQRSVFGLVHHTHPATAQLLDDAVVRDGLSDHFD